MSFKDWFTSGVTANPSNGGMGTANMFNAPAAGTQGPSPFDMLKNGKLAKLLMSFAHPNTPQTPAMPMQGQNIQNQGYTPYQSPMIAPNMGQVNKGGYSPNDYQ